MGEPRILKQRLLMSVVDLALVYESIIVSGIVSLPGGTRTLETQGFRALCNYSTK